MSGTASVSFACSPREAVTEQIVFCGARVARSPFSAKHRTLSVRGARIESICMPSFGEPAQMTDDKVILDLPGYMVLPGLINAHDHLDFALFPQLGHGPYRNWREWAADIYRPDQPPVEDHLRVPRELRFRWGGLRNLFCGVTTVSQHDRYLTHVLGPDFPVHVPSQYGWVHSVADPEKVTEQFLKTPPDWPFIIHLAEGTDQVAEREFDLLESLVPLNERVVLVHGVGLTSRQREREANAGTGVVWCPCSNLRTLGRTLSVEAIRELPNVALGTDSPLTANCDLLDQLRFVHSEMGAPAPFLYELVTSRAARLLRLDSRLGSLQAGGAADLIMVRDRERTPADTLVDLSWKDIELVVQAGRIMLLSPALSSQVQSKLGEGLESIVIDGIEKLVRMPVRNLYEQTCDALGFVPSLMGRTIEVCTEDIAC